MKKVLVSWVGRHDLEALSIDTQNKGPVFQTVTKYEFDTIVLLYNYPIAEVEPYLNWLRGEVVCEVESQYVELTSPVHFGEIYLAADSLLRRLCSNRKVELNILISPGTPAMQAVWILLGKTRYSAVLWQSSREQGVEKAIIPFDISAEYQPAAEKIGTDIINNMAAGNVPIDAAFKNIITKNPRMLELKAQATVLAEREVPVLICGESGTGKELFARAIHNASSRSDGPFVPVNCGAIPVELVDSDLFGHKKGAFTGAVFDKDGVFKQASGGTLFLDEFGELEKSIQVRLLRVLQDGVFTPVGSVKQEKADIRLITATNRDLHLEVSEGRFREDLFYRVAVGVLNLPPLRHREGDLLLLSEALLRAIGNIDAALNSKIFSINAKNIITGTLWRGNVRELHSTIFRAALWSQGDEITGEELKKAMFDMPVNKTSDLGRDISQGIDINEVISDVKEQYLQQALTISGGNKTKAAKLLGLGNPQTLSNWMKKI
jgi:transcriptional regulator with PAS, ATPase and Fis domain